MRSLRTVLVAAAAVCGCAGGAEPAGGPILTGVGSASQSTTTPAGESSSSEDSSDPDDDSDDSDSGGASEPGSSDGGEASSTTMPPDPSVGESSSDDGSPPAPDCPNSTTCNNAEVIGQVSGDEGSNTIDVAGSESVWLTFQVTEDNDSVVGESLSFTATLTSPPGVDFDLFAYRGAAGGPTGCNGAMDSSTSQAAVDVVHMSWGEAGVANGVDDRAWVAIEIVPKGDSCEDGSQWTLEVEGDS